jgi:outer membrane receptor for ferrienterochelin and colicins
MIFRILTSLFFLLSSTAMSEPGSLSGRVTTRGESGEEPLVAVSVFLQGTVRGTSTDANGAFRLGSIPAGTYSLVFSLLGYERMTRTDLVVEDGKETFVSVTMTQAPIQTAPVVVTANKRQQSLQEVPVSISLMEAAELRRRNSLTLEEALRYVPGVNMTGSQVNIRGSSGYSRGVGSRVLMLVDGIPFIAGDTGELIFESIPVGQVDRIEVVKGASSALYGSNALGGVINVITKPIPEIPETYLRTYGGFYNGPTFEKWKWSDKTRFFHGQSVSHALRSGNLGMALSFSRQVDDGYRQNDYRRRYNFYFKTREDFSSNNALTTTFSLLYQYGGQFVYWRNFDSALVPPVLQVSDNVKSTRFYATGLYNDALSANVLFTAKAIWNRNDWGYETINAIGRTESLSDDFRAEAGATVILDNVHTVTFGLDGQLDLVRSDLFSQRSGWGAAIYGQDEMKLGELVTLTLGTRCDLQALGLTESGPQVNPKIALTYAPVSGTTLRASAGRGYRIPSVAEAFISAEVTGFSTVPNADLKPEQSYSYEAGISQVLGTLGTLDIAAFRSDYDNLIEVGLEQDPTSSRAVAQWKNVTKARVQGFETSLRLGLLDGGLIYGLGYTYVYPEDRSKNDLLKYRPRHLFYTNVLGRVGVLRAGADFRYLSRVERIDELFVTTGLIPDADERVEILVADFRFGADLASIGIPLSLSFNVNNAFQYNYVELIANLMPPRTYSLVLEAKL